MFLLKYIKPISAILAAGVVGCTLVYKYAEYRYNSFSFVNFKVESRVEDGYRIYTVPNVKLTWKTSSPEMESYIPVSNKKIKIFRVPSDQTVMFTFYS